ncbi:MAG: hypothetical protein HYV07_15200 [Deltaproteobacteria bacterium]|nr:hypothetical protein [Deltaproteobacteria bacterium]
MTFGSVSYPGGSLEVAWRGLGKLCVARAREVVSRLARGPDDAVYALLAESGDDSVAGR